MLCSKITEFFGRKKITADISVFSDGAPLIEAYKKGESFDVLFLDICLETSDGMDIAAALRENDSDTPVIFVTGIDDRAIDGYRVSAFDYILKSSLKEHLPAALDRLMQKNAAQYMTVKTSAGDTAVVSFSDILSVESDGRGSAVYTLENNIIPSPLPVGKISELLPRDKFVEIHKSVFVRISQIKRIGADTVEMNGGRILPLSRRKRKQVLSAVMAAVKGRAK